MRKYIIRNTDIETDSLQQILVIIKPDGIHKGLTPDIIATLSDLHIVKCKSMVATLEKAKEHYAEHEGKPFFDCITTALASDKIMIIVLEGVQAVKKVRNVIGTSDDMTSIRGRYSNPAVKHENAIHGSDSVESAQKEINIWFN